MFITAIKQVRLPLHIYISQFFVNTLKIQLKLWYLSCYCVHVSIFQFDIDNWSLCRSIFWWQFILKYTWITLCSYNLFVICLCFLSILILILRGYWCTIFVNEYFLCRLEGDIGVSFVGSVSISLGFSGA